MLLMKAITLQGVFVGSRRMFEDMNRLIVRDNIRPVIDRVFPFVETPGSIPSSRERRALREGGYRDVVELARI